MRHAAPFGALAIIAATLAACDTDSAYRDAFAFNSAAGGPPLAPGAPVVTATDATFDRQLAVANSTAVINFTAKWCGPCRAMAPTLDSLAAESAGRIKVIRVDVDESPATARRYNISALPVLVMVRNGVVVKRVAGYRSRENLQTALASMPE